MEEQGVSQESMTLRGAVITHPACQGAPHPAGTAACRPNAYTSQGDVFLEEELPPAGGLEAWEQAAWAGQHLATEQQGAGGLSSGWVGRV